MSAQFQSMAGTTRPVADIRPVAGNVNDNANHGTPRGAVAGSCLVGDASMYVSVTGLLATDTVEYVYGGDAVTLANDQIQIPLGNEVFGLRILRASVEWAYFKLDEANGNDVYDSSGNNNHGTIFNPYVGQWGRQDVYSYANQEGYTDDSGVRIPAKTTLLDINDNPLQFKGKAQQNADLVEARCFHADSVASIYATITDSITDFTFETWMYHSSSEIDGLDIYIKAFGTGDASGGFFIANDSNNRLRVKCMNITVQGTDSIIVDQWYKAKVTLISGTLSLYVNDILMDEATGVPSFVKVDNELGMNTFSGREATFDIYDFCFGATVCGDLLELPLCEPVIDPANHTYFDVSGNGNHTILTNGSVSNEGIQDDFHYLEKYGYSGGMQPCFQDPTGNPEYRLTLDTPIILADSWVFSGFLRTNNDSDTGWRYIFGSNSPLNIFYYRNNGDGTSQFNVYDGSTTWYASGAIPVETKRITKFEISRSGNVMSLFVNGVNYPNTVSNDLTGLTIEVTTLGNNGQAGSGVQSKIWEFNYNDEHAWRLDGDGLDSIGNNNLTPESSDGSSDFWKTIDEYIPASQLDSNKDALGNTLQFPPIEWLGQSKLKFPETPECIQADQGNFLFDVSGNAIAKTKAELTGIQGSWIYGGGNTYRLHLANLSKVKDKYEKLRTNN